MSGTPESQEYRVLLLLPDGRQEEATFGTRRPRNRGDTVVLPVGPDGQPQEGPGHIWRVTSVDSDLRLRLEYIRIRSRND